MMQKTTLYIYSFSYNIRVDLWLNWLELAVSLLFAIDVFNTKQSLKWYWIGPKLRRLHVCVCVCVCVCGCCCCWGWRRPSQLSAYSSALSRMCTAKVRPRTQEVEKTSKPAVCPLEVPSKALFWNRPLQDLGRLPLALSSSSIG